MNGAVTSEEKNVKGMTMDTEKSGQIYIWYNYDRSWGLFQGEFRGGEKGEQ